MGSSPSTGSQLEYRLLGVGVIALFIVYGIAARSINTAGMTDPLGAAYVPTMLAIIGTVLGALMVIASFFKREHRAVAPIELTTERPPNLRLALAILSLPFLWPLLLPHTGYLLTTSVLVSLLVVPIERTGLEGNSGFVRRPDGSPVGSVRRYVWRRTPGASAVGVRDGTDP